MRSEEDNSNSLYKQHASQVNENAYARERLEAARPRLNNFYNNTQTARPTLNGFNSDKTQMSTNATSAIEEALMIARGYEANTKKERNNQKTRRARSLRKKIDKLQKAIQSGKNTKALLENLRNEMGQPLRMTNMPPAAVSNDLQRALAQQLPSPVIGNGSVQQLPSPVNANGLVQQLPSPVNGNGSVQQLPSPINANGSVQQLPSPVNGNGSVQQLPSPINANGSASNLNATAIQQARNVIARVQNATGIRAQAKNVVNESETQAILSNAARQERRGKQIRNAARGLQESLNNPETSDRILEGQIDYLKRLYALKGGRFTRKRW